MGLKRQKYDTGVDKFLAGIAGANYIISRLHILVLAR